MQKSKGSFTIEAIIVVSTMIFIIFAIIIAFLLIYQNAVMVYVATQAAQEGAIYWTDSGHSLDGTDAGEDTQSLYYRVPELFNGGNIEGKKEVIKVWAENKMKEMCPGTIVGSGHEEVNVDFKNYVVQRIIEVKITKEINIPFKQIARYFDADLDLHVTAQASISDPAEYIRNIDYGLELLDTLWNAVKGKLGDLFSSVS